MIKLPGYNTTYRGTYTVNSGVTDFDSTDNVISFEFTVGGNYFAHEDGPTRSFSINGNVWIFEPPLATTFGNIFRPASDVLADHIIWGVHNPGDMMGKTVSVLLSEWTDTNGNLIAEAAERRIVGFKDYTFTGNEDDNVILESSLENFENPGHPIFMRAGFNYMAMVQYEMTSIGDPELFLLASEARDFSVQVMGMDSAYSIGLTDDRLFMTAFGFSPDGIIYNTDYEVRELDVNDNRVHFGNDIVPLIRIGLSNVDTKNALPFNNLITIYPNPTSDNIEVKLEFEKPYRDVQLHLINQSGQYVFNKVIHETFTTHTESISVENLTAGNYLLQVDTKDGQRSIPVVVIK